MSGLPLPVSVDWRSRWGLSWVTGIRDQDPCEACWAFAATALIESMVRINHGVWAVLSEGDVHDGLGTKCGSCGNAHAALDWVKSNGLADPACYGWPGNRAGPYFNPPPTDCIGAKDYTGTTQAPNYTPTGDHSGRSVRIDGYTDVGSVSDQKKWLDTVGPLICGFDVYEDFGGAGAGVYKHQAGYKYLGGHVMLVIGYDDNQKCWIVKNSWGPYFGDNGYVLIGYGQCNIDTYAKTGLTLTNPDPWTKRRLHGGNIVESGNGASHRNFEMLLSAKNGALQHWWRDNSKSGYPWAKAYAPFGNDAAPTWPTLTETTFNRNFEAVCLTTSKRLRHWWFDENTKKWNDGGIFGPTDAAGLPGFIQGNFGAPGNFEVVVGTNDQRLNHWWRDKGSSGYQWHDGGRFGSGVAFSGPTLLQSTYGSKGNFELVCVLDSGKMQHWWRNNDDTSYPRSASATFGSGIRSHPCMIEGMYGATDEYKKGNFELCVAAGGMVQHWWRDNGGSGAWNHSATFGDGHITAEGGLLEGCFGFNLELIVERADGHVQHYWRDGSLNWHPGAIIL